MKFRGKIVKGAGIGNKFGVATANLFLPRRPKLKEGVYLVRAFLDGKKLNGIMHFGELKTFDRGFSAEVHLLDFDKKIYDEVLEVEVLKKIDDTRKFPNKETLFANIQKQIIHAKKFFLREEINQRWGNVSAKIREAMGKTAAEKVLTHPRFQKAKNVFLYAPSDREIPFVEMVCQNAPEKNYFFPKVCGTQMKFFRSHFEDLKKGAFDILEPTNDCKSATNVHPDLIFVPSVAVGKDKNRLGRGAGFYDRFLINENAWKICIIPSFAVYKNIPVTAHDQAIDEVIAVS